MSLSASPAVDTPPHLRSPKRKRSHSPVNGYGYDGTGDGEEAQLQFAYEDPPSELQSPSNDDGGDSQHTASKRRRLERPRRLDYKPYMTLKGHKRGVAGVRFSPDGKWIASCYHTRHRLCIATDTDFPLAADATIKIWSSSSGALHATLEGHLAGVSCVAWSPDSKVLASGSDDKLIRLWDVSSAKPLPQPLQGHHNYVYSLAFSPKGNILVSGSYDEAVFLWDIRTARLMRSLPAHSDPVSGVDFVRDGTLAASCSSDGLIRIWDTSTGQCLKTLVHEDNAPVTSVRFSPNGKFVLATTLDSSVRLWDYVDGRCLKTYQGHKNERFSLNACFGVYKPELGYLGEEEDVEGEDQRWAFTVCGSEDGRLFLWDVSSKEILQRLDAHDGVVLGVDVGLEDQTIATCGMDKTIRLWKRHSLPPELAHEPLHNDAVNGSVAVTEIPATNGLDVSINGIASTEVPSSGAATPAEES